MTWRILYTAEHNHEFTALKWLEELTELILMEHLKYDK